MVLTTVTIVDKEYLNHIVTYALTTNVGRNL